MKIILYVALTSFTVLTFSMCDSSTPKAPSVTVSQVDSPGTGKSTDACMSVSAEDSSKYISKTMVVKGDVEFPLVLTVDSLRKMKIAVIDNFKVVCQNGANKKEDRTCRGVLLKDILEKAKIKQSNHKDRNFYIVARATDNYKATFSWGELFNNPTGENTYVLFEENGEPIRSQGEMILTCKNDIKAGPRHVFWLTSIEVNRVK
jgi:hypothetical protein